MQKSWLTGVFAIVVTCLASSFLYAAAPFNTLIAVGEYGWGDPSIISLPLLALSNDQGKTWSYPPDIFSKNTLPADFLKEGLFSSVRCNADFCIAVGKYHNSDWETKTLTAVSRNHGALWSYVTAVPEYVKDALFGEQTTCNNTLCVLISGYKNEEYRSIPLISVTRDKGTSWSYVTNLADSQNNVTLRGVDCTERSCIVVGTRSDNRSWSIFPYIAVSTDQAATWSVVKLNLPFPYMEIAMHAVKCTEDVCIATGGYSSSPQDPGLTGVFILRSTDGGLSWSVAPIAYQPNPGTGAALSSIIHPDSNTWIVSGYDNTPQNTDRPLVYISSDNGKIWSRPPTILSNFPTKIATHEVIQPGNVSCTGDLCIVPISASHLDDQNGSAIVLAISHDRGVTWSYTDVTPVDMGGRSSTPHVSCNENSCFVASDYQKFNDRKKPFIIVSNDHGRTWYSPSTITSNLPGNSKWGEFHNVI